MNVIMLNLKLIGVALIVIIVLTQKQQRESDVGLSVERIEAQR